MAKEKKPVSMSVIKRLPRYYRFLGELKKNNVLRISSKELSQRMGFTASQIRQDLNCFGGFGQQGYGYNVELLRQGIGYVIGIENCYKIILVGAGNLGRAVAQHLNFNKRGFDLIGIFDSDEALTGTKISDMSVKHFSEIEEFCKKEKPTAAILCVPSAAGKNVTQKLVECGINSFWNFSHYNINEDFPNAIVENVHLNDSLMTLCFNITNAEGEK